MQVDRIRPGQLTGLLQRYPQARFVLMHTGYPYTDELIAIAKHYPNVFVDMCWSWSIDPHASVDFLRRMLHTVPVNKLFVFGGDTFWPNAAVSFAVQARAWLSRALHAEVSDGLLTEGEAIALATRLMRVNQSECFAIDHKRAAIRAIAHQKL
jgi:predicted TIM-barrel fold metal-dependent hydrolase